MALKRSLHDSFQIIAPHLSEDLVAPEQLNLIQKLVKKLAPIHCAGFECRLTGPNERVDLQQRIRTINQEPERLKTYIDAAGLKSNSDWGKIFDLCGHLQNSDTILSGNISKLWLEFDLDIRPADNPAPSVFISLNQVSSKERLRFMIESILILLLGKTIFNTLEGNIRRCIEAGGDKASISDIGTMLSRHPETIRLNIGGLTPDELSPFLSNIGWPGLSKEIERHFRYLYRLVDYISLCLDVDTKVHPQIGMECFLIQQPADEPRWKQFLDALIKQGFCSQTQRNALMSWPGYTYPSHTDFPWPNEMILESLLESADKFSVIGRRLSHIKLVFLNHTPVDVKAYFGYGPLWLEPQKADNDIPDQDKRVLNSSSPERINRKGGIEKSVLMRAIEKCMDFLTEMRDGNGWWKDFESLEAGSDEWVTAYTATACTKIPLNRARRIAKFSWQLLCQRRKSGDGWGYNLFLPVDMDGTAWGLRLAYALGELGSQRARAAKNILREHIQPNGGVVSYSREACPRRHDDKNSSIDGWCSIHNCVTAAAAIEAFGQKPRNFLLHHQQKNGSWKGYWWFDHEYTTALAAEALADANAQDNRNAVAAATGWVLGNLKTDGAIYSTAHHGTSAFATACALRILMSTSGNPDLLDSLNLVVDWLLSHQQSDGSWVPSARLRVPPAYAVNPEEHINETVVFLDQKGIFTTATVLMSLGAFGRYRNFF